MRLEKDVEADVWTDDLASVRTVQSPSHQAQSLKPLVGIILLATGFVIALWTASDGSSALATSGSRPSAAHAINRTTLLLPDGPHAHFRDSLRPDVRYVTSLHAGYHSNQFIGIEHLLQLAKLLDRVAVVMPATALHFPPEGIPWSALYDMEHLYSMTGIPFVEWIDLKPSGPVGTPLPSGQRQQRDVQLCYNTYSYITKRLQLNHDDSVAALGTDVFQSRLFASNRKALASGPCDSWVLGEHCLHYEQLQTWDAQRNVATEAAIETLTQTIPAEADRAILLSSPNLVCFDQTYFLAYPPAIDAPSVDTRPSIDGATPSWHTIGRHMRFAKSLEQLADLTLIRLLGLPEETILVPPYMVLHVRRGDFIDLGWDTPQLTVYCDALTDLRVRLESKHASRNLSTWRSGYTDWYQSRPDPRSLPVLVASDDDSVGFRSAVESYGWIYIDHTALKTEEKYGSHAPTMVDSIILSRAIGLVGSYFSTFSMLASLRIEDWNDGVSTFATAR